MNPQYFVPQCLPSDTPQCVPSDLFSVSPQTLLSVFPLRYFSVCVPSDRHYSVCPLKQTLLSVSPQTLLSVSPQTLLSVCPLRYPSDVTIGSFPCSSLVAFGVPSSCHSSVSLLMSHLPRQLGQSDTPLWVFVYLFVCFSFYWAEGLR